MEFLLQKSKLNLLGFVQCIALLVAVAAQAQTTTLFTDSSLTAKTVSAYGDATVVEGQSKFGGPIGVFDGAGDYLVVSPSPLEANPKSFTIEAWVYITDIPANGWPIVSQSANGATGEQQLFVSGSNGGATNQNKLRFSRGASATNPIDLIGTTQLPLNQWVHVALSVDGTTARLFVNGNLDASVALSSGWVDTAQAFYVATTLNSTAPQNQSFAKGKISDLRVTKNSGRYKGTFIPYATETIDTALPLDTNWLDTSLVITANEVNSSRKISDTSPAAKIISVLGNLKITTSQSKYGNSSIYFGGPGNSLQVSETSRLVGNGDFTVEGWIYKTTNNPYQPIIGQTRYGAYHANTWTLYLNSSGTLLVGQVSNNGSPSAGNTFNTIGKTIITNNAWHHVAMTVSGNVLRIFLDGVLEGTTTISGNFSDIGVNTTIGTDAINPTTYFIGYMDDLRITKGVARYTTNFTPTEIPPTPVKMGDVHSGNVSLLINANGINGTTKIGDLSQSAKAISIVGDTKIATGQSKFGGSSLLFDGNGDYLSIASTPDFGFGTQDFTIEMFVNPIVSPAAGQNITLLDSRGSMGYSPFTVSLYGNTTGTTLGFFAGNNNAYITTSSPTIPLNSWTHLAWVRQNGIINLYVNGNKCTLSAGSETSSGAVNLGSTLPLKIGIAADVSTGAYSGYIDDLRITKGVARYSGNFTPPTSQLEPARFIKDPYSNRVSLLLLSGATEIDNIPPYITTTSKLINVDASLNGIQINFNKSIEPSSFTAAQVTVTDTAQHIIPVSSVGRITDTEYKVNFEPPLLAGTYTLKVWPEILGINGLPLDQNRNGVGGELTDAFEQNIVVNYSLPAAVTPTVNTTLSTGTSLTLSWPAYVKPVNGRDISVFRIYTSLIPFTNINQATKVLEVSGTATSATVTGLLSNTTYYIAIVPVDTSGSFSPQVTPIVAKALSANEHTTTYTYNTAGQILTEDGPRTDVNDTTTYTYDSLGRRLTVTNALGHQLRYDAYDNAGRLLSVTDANGIKTEFTYHDRGWLLSSRTRHPTNSALDSVTSYSYDPVGLMTGMTLPNGYQLTYEYDGARRLTAIKNPAGERIEYTLDAAGNHTQQKIKNNAGTIVYSVTQAFDELSRVMDITGNNGQNEKHQYDVNDNTTAVTNGRNHKTQQTYDALNRVAKVIDPALKETQFTYDSQNRIKTVTDARGNTTSYNYDGFGNVLSQSSPDTGLTTFSYDAAGNRTSAVDARGVVVNYTYDALNRLVNVQYPAAVAENITYTYDSMVGGSYGIGRLSSISTAASTLNYSYNHLGLVSQKQVTLNGQLGTVSYAYDTNGNLIGITYPSGRIVTYTRDSAGRVQAVKTKFNSTATEQTVISAVNYLPFGPIKSYTYGNGLTHTLSYDNDYRLTDIVLGGLMVRNYNYDAADNITTIIDGVSSTKTQNFTYDNLDRLTSASGIYGYQAFSYDGVGNRTGFLFDNGTAISSDTYSYETTSNRLSYIDNTTAGLATGTRNFSYDNAGNLLQGTAENGTDQTYTYNKANRLTTAKAGINLLGTYVYNTLGQRMSKTYADGSKELFHYDEAGQLIAVTNASGNTLREYIYNGNILVGYVNAGIVAYVHNDHQGTPQVITAQNQNVLWMADYEPFGKAKLGTNNTIAFSARFPGQYLDSETGIYYNYFRDYDPSIGRYIESDPIGLQGGINTYAYVEGNPVSFTDPYGLKKWDYDGWGNTAACSYYDDLAQKSGCNYYKEAAKICRGQKPLVNMMLEKGIEQAWMSDNTNASQSQIADRIRQDLIKYDQIARALNDRGYMPPRGDHIDLYHNLAFQNANINTFWYGGNRWPQSVWPNPVPYDPAGNSKYDPRNKPSSQGDSCGCLQ